MNKTNHISKPSIALISFYAMLGGALYAGTAFWSSGLFAFALFFWCCMLGPLVSFAEKLETF